MLYPNSRLTGLGFEADWVGVEVKHIDHLESGNTGKAAHLTWQAISYQQTEFYLPNGTIRPRFTLVYVGEVKFPEFAFPRDMGMVWHTLMHVAYYFGVMQIEALPKSAWWIIGPGGIYFHKLKGRLNLNPPSTLAQSS